MVWHSYLVMVSFVLLTVTMGAPYWAFIQCKEYVDGFGFGFGFGLSLGLGVGLGVGLGLGLGSRLWSGLVLGLE